MPRGLKKPSKAFQAVFDHGHADLWQAWTKATEFVHKGLRGDTREEGIRQFLRDHLPKQYAVTSGEVIDARDGRSSQLDVMIYDQQRNCPLVQTSSATLLPAESLLAVVEVKTTLTQDELDKSYAAAAKLKLLRPYKDREFICARPGGASAADNHPRLFHTLLAFKTNLGANSWVQNEWTRIKSAVATASSDLRWIDRVYVLDRGIFNPTANNAKEVGTEDSILFRDWFLHLVNFLARENARREPIDWQLYGPRSTKGWISLP